MTCLTPLTSSDLRNEAFAEYVFNMDGEKLFNLLFDNMSDKEWNLLSEKFQYPDDASIYADV